MKWCLSLKSADSPRDQNITSLYINGKLRLSTFYFLLFKRLARKPIKDMMREKHVYQMTYMYVFRNVSRTYMYVFRSEKVNETVKITYIHTTYIQIYKYIKTSNLEFQNILLFL